MNNCAFFSRAISVRFSQQYFVQCCCKYLLFPLFNYIISVYKITPSLLNSIKDKEASTMCTIRSSKIIWCSWPTMVSLITDADNSTCTVAVAAAEPRAGLSNVNMVHSPAVSLSCPLFLNPAKLSSPGNIQQKI